MRLTGDPAPGTMNSSSGSGSFLLVPIPEYPLVDCVPNKTVKIVVLGATSVGKTGMDAYRGVYWNEGKMIQQFASLKNPPKKQLYLNCAFQWESLGIAVATITH